MNITIRRPFDGHLHLRRGDMLRRVFCHSAKDFSAGIIMSNTVPPVDADNVDTYRAEIEAAARENALQPRGTKKPFQPIMTIQGMESTTPEMVYKAWKLGVKAMKVYPKGMTSNSEWGVQDYRRLFPAFQAAREVGMIVLFHGEAPSQQLFCLDREEAFLDTLNFIINKFPRLKVVLEHITTCKAVYFVTKWHQLHPIAATITPHHMLLTLNDVVGGKLQPHHFCKPLAKREEDRQMVVRAAISGLPCYFLGTDSAPWLREQKECNDGCAGIFNAPVALPVVAGVFEEQNALDRLEAFVSINGPSFYGLAPADATLTLSKEPWQVPAEYGGIVPFRAGEKLEWQVAD